MMDRVKERRELMIESLLDSGFIKKSPNKELYAMKYTPEWLWVINFTEANEIELGITNDGHVQPFAVHEIDPDMDFTALMFATFDLLTERVEGAIEYGSEEEFHRISQLVKQSENN